VGVVRDEGRAMSRDHHDLEASELTLSILRKFDAGHLSAKLYVGHQRFSPCRSYDQFRDLSIVTTSTSPSLFKRSARASRWNGSSSTMRATKFDIIFSGKETKSRNSQWLHRHSRPAWPSDGSVVPGSRS
jgi:hypothetical protein